MKCIMNIALVNEKKAEAIIEKSAVIKSGWEKKAKLIEASGEMRVYFPKICNHQFISIRVNKFKRGHLVKFLSQ